MSLTHGHSSSLGFGASFGHSCGRFVDHGGHGGRFFFWIRFDVVPTLAFALEE